MEIYLVGGAVRDRLLGQNTQDKDWVVVGATIEQMIFLGFKPVGKKFPVFIHPKTKEEYALARTEKKVGQGYQGFIFYTEPSVTLEEDLLRRDLTINAMAMDASERLIDPYNGQRDLKNKTLRHVSQAFTEDPVRILRVARFIAKLGFKVDPSTLSLIENMIQAGELKYLVKERVFKEFFRAISEKYLYEMFVFLQQSGFFKEYLIELGLVFKQYTEVLHKIFKSHEFIVLDVIDRLAILSYFFVSEKQLQVFLQMLILSKKTDRYLLTFYQVAHAYQSENHISAEIVLSLLEDTDALRQTDRWFKLSFLLNSLVTMLGLDFPVLNIDLNYIISQLQNMDVLSMVVGKKGKEIGDIVRQARLKVIKQLL